MIEFNESKSTFVCPFCGTTQALNNSTHRTFEHYPPSVMESREGPVRMYITPDVQAARTHKDTDAEFRLHSLQCSSNDCGKTSVLAINIHTGQQIDVLPQYVVKSWPDYIPLQIRADYEEACRILNSSPKAAATLARRCLQGMIRDFWDIHDKRNLNAEIQAIKDEVNPSLWKAIDAVRSIGNIGAHMEQDVNLIVDVDEGEAEKLISLIELLFKSWYIDRAETEALLTSITEISKKKQAERKSN